MLEKLATAVRTMTLTNVLILALIAIIMVPTYFAYRFMVDEEFRRSLMATAVIVDKHVPCLVLEAHRLGAADRHTIGVVYGIEGRLEKIISLRAPSTLSDSEIDDVCKRVIVMADELKK